MILCDQEIRQLCLTADLVTPFNPDLINPASIDVRLGDTLLIESAQSRELVVYPLDRHSEEIPYELRPELHNSRQLWPQLLWPGMKIGQMVFHRMSDLPLRSYAQTGRYNGHATVHASKG
jgi:dCTP deaminase